MIIGNAVASQAEGTRTRIINSNGGDQKSLDIQGDKIVWADSRNEKGEIDYTDLYFGRAGNWDIYMYNLSTSREVQITTNTSTQFNPVIYGDRIVWQDNRNGNWDIYMYDISTSKENRISTHKSDQTRPAIYEDKIVWQDNRNGNLDIYMYNISNSTEKQLTNNTSNQSESVIYGDKIVWVDEIYITDPEIAVDPYFAVNNIICVYDLATSKETQLSSGLRIWNPSIYEDTIVWVEEDFVGNNAMVLMYNLSTSTETLIAYERAGDPDVYKDKIVWSQDLWDFRNHIFMYNISTSTQTEITAEGVHEPGSGSYPSIYDDKIVWAPSSIDSDYRRGIYMFTLNSPADNSNKEAGVETQITTNGSFQANPVIYEDRIIWEDARNGKGIDQFGYPGGGWDIYMYNLSTHKEIQFTNDSTDKQAPDIYRDGIVWHEWQDGKPGIHIYNISTSNRIKITDEVANNPVIYKDRIIWAINNIYMYDLSTSKQTQISNSMSYQDYPAIFGDTIVWTEDRNGNLDIYMYNLSTLKETQITTNNSIQRLPAIYEDRIVWEDNRNGNWDIYMYNLPTSIETQITSNEFNQGFPSIYRDRIVWIDDRSGRTDIYMYNLSASRETRITSSGSVIVGLEYDVTWGSGVGEPSIYGDRIVWGDFRNGNSDIYMFTLQESKPTIYPPVANFTATPLSGQAPLKVKFTSTSTGSPAEWKWNFGDGSPLVTEQNPEHTYSKAGIYTVKHTAINAIGRDTEIKTKYVTVTSPALPVKAPVAAFSAAPRSGKAPLKVKFTDKSTGSPTSWKWSFGDGKYSVVKSPEHTYSKAGKYNVTLTVKNAKGSSTKTISKYIAAAKK